MGPLVVKKLTHFMPRPLSDPLKTSENLWFSDAFRGCKKRPVARNVLMG